MDHAPVTLPATDDPLGWVRRVVAGAPTPEDMGVLSAGLARWMDAGFSLPLERVLKLPETAGKANRMQRDYWLMQAGVALELLPASDPWLASVEVHRRWALFLDGPWRHWKARRSAPAGADRLSEIWFNASKFSGGRLLGIRSVYNALGGEPLKNSDPKISTDPAHHGGIDFNA